MEQLSGWSRCRPTQNLSRCGSWPHRRCPLVKTATCWTGSTATGRHKSDQQSAPSADFKDLRTKSSVSDWRSATRQESRMGILILGEEGWRKALYFSSSGIWTLQVTLPGESNTAFHLLNSLTLICSPTEKDAETRHLVGIVPYFTNV